VSYACSLLLIAHQVAEAVHHSSALSPVMTVWLFCVIFSEGAQDGAADGAEEAMADSFMSGKAAGGGTANST